MSQCTVQMTRDQLIALDQQAGAAGLTRDALAANYVAAGIEAAAKAAAGKPPKAAARAATETKPAGEA